MSAVSLSRLVLGVAPLVALVLLGAPPAGGASSASSEQAPLLLCQERQNVWQRVRVPQVEPYCRLVASAMASVWSDPQRAIGAASRAADLEPKGLEAPLVRALAELSASRPDSASAAFEVALSQTQATEIPAPFRLGAARSALLSGKYPEALVHYRRLALSVDALAGPRLRAQVLMEASLSAYYSAPDGGEEARAFLRQARSHFAPLLWPLGHGILALTHLNDTQASVAEGEDSDSYYSLAWALERSPRARGAPFEVLPVLPPSGGAAILGALARLVAPEEASARFAEFLEEPRAQPAHILQGARRWAED